MICINVVNIHPIITGNHDPTMSGKLRPAIDSQDNSPALWVSQNGESISYWGLNEIIERRARKAGVHKPELHAFRRAFDLECLRAGVDLFSLQKLMGHADLQ